MPKVVDHEERRMEIASTALRLIHQRGLENTTLREIAREAGHKHTAMAYYFSNKKELIAYAFDVLCTQWIENAQNRASAASHAAHAIRDISIEYLPAKPAKRSVADMGSFALSLKMQSSENAQIRDLSYRFSVALRAMLREQVIRMVPATGPVSATDVESLVELIALTLDGLALEACSNPDAFDEKRAIASVERLLERLFGDAATAV